MFGGGRRMYHGFCSSGSGKRIRHWQWHDAYSRLIGHKIVGFTCLDPASAFFVTRAAGLLACQGAHLISTHLFTLALFHFARFDFNPWTLWTSVLSFVLCECRHSSKLWAGKSVQIRSRFCLLPRFVRERFPFCKPAPQTQTLIVRPSSGCLPFVFTRPFVVLRNLGVLGLFRLCTGERWCGGLQP